MYGVTGGVLALKHPSQSNCYQIVLFILFAPLYVLFGQMVRVLNYMHTYNTISLGESNNNSTDRGSQDVLVHTTGDEKSVLW